MPLADWIGRLLTTAALLGGYPPGAPVPEVLALSQQELARQVCSGDCAARGAYVAGRGVLLLDTLDIDSDPRDRSVLLHELVHYLQDRFGRFAAEPACDRYIDREAEAYAIQDRYLARYDMGLSDAADAMQWVPATCRAPAPDVSEPVQLER